MAKNPIDPNISETHGKIWDDYPTVWDLLVEAAETHASRTALVCVHQKYDLLGSITQTTRTSGYLRWTFSELMRASHALAQALAASGISPGMRIVAYLSNCAEHHIVFRAALELNCTFVPLNPAAAKNTAEVKNIFEMIQPSVLVVQNAEAAKSVAERVWNDLEALKLRLVVDEGGGSAGESWQHFESFVANTSVGEKEQSALQQVERKEDDVILVLMTSGTTSLPKGCPHTNISLGSIIRAQKERTSADDTRVLCQHLPVSHIFGLQTAYSFFIQGLPIVHPSTSFDAGSTLRAIHEERCSDWAGVPAMATTILNHPDMAKTDTSSMKWVILGATTSSTAVVRSVMEAFGCVVSDGYGMSEGAPTAETAMRDAPRDPPSRIHSGPATAGSKLRVCDPESNKVLPRGETGELHQGGTNVIREYWLNPSVKKDKSDFYHDDAGHWLKTGDQAIMDSDGNIEVVGRYKHLIIRGGENISPKSMEAEILKQFNLQSDVVGLPDDMAGEVPVAILKPSKDQKVERADIKKALISELGPAFAPEYILDVSELGLEDFPKTLSGKVKKNILQEMLVKHFEQEASEFSRPNGAGDSTYMNDTLIEIWSGMLGVNDLTPESRIMEWADSLTLSRFPGVLQRKTGQSVALHELLKAETISAQSQLLHGRTSSLQQSPAANLQVLPERDGPPGKEDMAHVHNDEQRFQKTRELAEAALQQFGMGWEHVKEITPLYSFLEHFLTRRRPQSNNHRHAFVCAGNSVSDCRAAVTAALSRHPIFCSLAINFEKDFPLHVMVRPVGQWFDACITEVPPVKSAADLEHLVFNDPNLDYAAAPGPLFRVVLTHVEDEDCAGMVYMVQHSVFDGISLPFLLEDLDALLNDKQAESNLTQRIPFKAWADSEYNLRDSLSARLSVEWHAQRLKGISAAKAALFPEQRAIEWFKGNAKGWIDLSTGKPGPERKPLDPESNGVKGFSETCHLPDAHALKKEHGVEAFAVVKAALALLNRKQTNANTAFFAQYQAARTWPYLPEWQQATLPPAMEVDGPTVQTVVVAITPQANATVAEFMQSVQADQELITQHQHAPFARVVQTLNENGSGDGDVMVDIWRRQIFNWLPRTSGENFKRLRRTQQISRTDVGLLWNCMQLDAESVQVMPSWDDAQLTPARVQQLLQQLMELAKLLASRQMWQRSLDDLAQAASGEQNNGCVEGR